VQLIAPLFVLDPSLLIVLFILVGGIKVIFGEASKVSSKR